MDTPVNSINYNINNFYVIAKYPGSRVPEYKSRSDLRKVKYRSEISDRMQWTRRRGTTRFERFWTICIVFNPKRCQKLEQFLRQPSQCLTSVIPYDIKMALE